MNGKPSSMRVVRNRGGGLSHRAALKVVIEGAESLWFAVAFLKAGGSTFLSPLLARRLVAGASVTAYVGTDFFLTEPTALSQLFALAERHPRFKIFVADTRPGETFHPKAYLARGAVLTRCLVGSANLTAGALGANEEISLLAEGNADEPLPRDLSAVFDAYAADPRFNRLTRKRLNDYAARYDAAAKMRLAVAATIIDAGFDELRLGRWLRAYRKSSQYREELPERREKRRMAVPVQDEIARLPDQGRLLTHTRDAFSSRLRRLMSGVGPRDHLWNSGSIFRRGSEALNHVQPMIRLFRKAKAAARSSASEGFEDVRAMALSIPGVGLNMMTEMLATWAPDRYPVFNGNTRGALAELGVQVSGGLSLTQFKSTNYLRACVVLEALRQRIGGVDFTDADAFLNFVYWRAKEER